MLTVLGVIIIIFIFFSKLLGNDKPVSTQYDEYSYCIKEEFGYGNGQLVVGKNSWYIEFVKQPDRRYKPRTHRVNSYSVNSYISAFRANWETYLKIKNELAVGSEIETTGLLGMIIRVGKEENEGIYLPFGGYTFQFVSNKEDLESLLLALKMSESRANQMMEFINK